jgi:hypothetical protein
MRDDIGEDRYHDQPERLAFDVRQRIERNLSAVKCGGIAAQPGDQRVRAFMARGRKQKDDVPDKSED